MDSQNHISAEVEKVSPRCVFLFVCTTDYNYVSLLIPEKPKFHAVLESSCFPPSLTLPLDQA